AERDKDCQEPDHDSSRKKWRPKKLVEKYHRASFEARCCRGRGNRIKKTLGVVPCSGPAQSNAVVRQNFFILSPDPIEPSKPRVVVALNITAQGIDSRAQHLIDGVIVRDTRLAILG